MERIVAVKVVMNKPKNDLPCAQTGHKSSKSKKCKPYKPTLDHTLINELDEGYERFTRKLHLEIVIKSEHKESVVEKIAKFSSFIRNAHCKFSAEFEY